MSIITPVTTLARTHPVAASVLVGAGASGTGMLWYQATKGEIPGPVATIAPVAIGVGVAVLATRLGTRGFGFASANDVHHMGAFAGSALGTSAAMGLSVIANET